MTSLSDTIAWLRRLAVVSCPEITCQQAAEVAEMLERLNDDLEDQTSERMRLFDLLGKRNGEFSAKCMEAIRFMRERDAAIRERDALKTEVEAQASTIARLQNLLDPELLPHPGSGRLLSASPINAQRRRDDINIADTKCMRCGIYTDSGVLCSACRVRGDK